MTPMQTTSTKSRIDGVDDDVSADSVAKLAHPKYIQQFREVVSIHILTECLLIIQMCQCIRTFYLLQFDPEVVFRAYDRQARWCTNCSAGFSQWPK